MLRIKLSNRAKNTPASPIRKLAPLAAVAKKSGKHVFHLNIGQPDIETPDEFFDGLKLFDQKIIAYDPSQGNEDLAKSWSLYMNKTLNLNTTYEDFLITVGASEALIFLFMTCCDPGDEVIIFDPTYANYIGFASVSGINLVPIHSDIEKNFALPPVETIEAAMTNRTRAILLCTPNNPTGTVYTKEEIKLLLDLCEEHNIFLIADETYREYVYDDAKPLSVLHLAPNNERVIVVDSLSKRFSLCGARIGCMLTTNREVLSTTLKIAQARLSAPTLGQFAAAYMLGAIKGEYLENVRREYEHRRNVLFSAISSVSGVVAHKPKGAFYTVVRFPVDDADKFAAFLLKDFSLNGKTTFLAPAEGFYMQNGRGKQEARIAYVLKSSEIIQAVEIIEAGLNAYNNA